jgi:hypothetical protein
MDSITLAIQELESLEPGEKIKSNKVAKKYGVDRSTLSRRFRGKTGSKKAKYDSQQFLTKQQSKTLCEYVDKLTRRGLPPTTAMITNFAADIAGKRPGINWVARWLKQQSHLLIIKNSKGLDIDRKRAENERKYKAFLALMDEKL